MFNGDEEHYFSVSPSALKFIDAALALASKTEVRSVHKYMSDDRFFRSCSGSNSNAWVRRLKNAAPDRH